MTKLYVYDEIIVGIEDFNEKVINIVDNILDMNTNIRTITQSPNEQLQYILYNYIFKDTIDDHDISFYCSNVDNVNSDYLKFRFHFSKFAKFLDLQESSGLSKSIHYLSSDDILENRRDIIYYLSRKIFDDDIMSTAPS